MARRVGIKSPAAVRACSYLRNLSSNRSIVAITIPHPRPPQRWQSTNRAPFTSCRRSSIHGLHGYSIQATNLSSPTIPSSLSKCYLSAKPTADVVAATPTLIEDLTENATIAPPPPSTKNSSAGNVETSTALTPPSSSIPLVYESPLGSVVSKLRTVSLCTALIGMTGVPCMIALKGGTIPETGILAAALLFVSGSMGSTAAIHFVFSPYVYKIEQIPIRICSSTLESSAATETTAGSGDNNNSINTKNETSTTKPNKDTLLKAWTRTLFLRNDAIIFDPALDVQPYKGLRPMCNFLAKGCPLYVHPGTWTKFQHHWIKMAKQN